MDEHMKQETDNKERYEGFFRIGAFLFSLTCPVDLTIPEHFQKFRIDEAEALKVQTEAYAYEIEYVTEFPPFQGQATVQRPDIMIFRTEAGEARLLGVKGNPCPYALYMEESPTRTHVYFDRSRAEGLSVDPIFASLFALEKHMIGLDSMILHCAYMEYEGGAVLFSAPSETGKTTQANLWKKYRGNETVNGDRSLLRRVDGVWTAGGWPVCGTSEICENRDLPVHAIVMLSQSRDGQDTIERMRPADAFSRLYSQITINTWNPQFTVKVMDLIEDLIGEVPVYHLTCTMTEEAVKVLEEKLRT